MCPEIPSAAPSVSDWGTRNAISARAGSRVRRDIPGYKPRIVAVGFSSGLSVRDPSPADVSGVARFPPAEIPGLFAVSRRGWGHWGNLRHSRCGRAWKIAPRAGKECSPAFPSSGMRSTKGRCPWMLGFHEPRTCWVWITPNRMWECEAKMSFFPLVLS